MHIAPWIKHSISVSLGMFARIVFISSSESSLARTTRFTPYLLQKFIAAELTVDAWVER